jgi:hypothetical protein
MNNFADELPKKMLILKSHSSALSATETFLRNRGWEIYSTSDLKEALIQVVSKKHSYILISIDHANKKIPMLPKLISEKYNVAVITFAESTSARSFNTLTKSPTDYKIYAPVTGPAVERCINKYSKDLETARRLQAKNDDLQEHLFILKQPKLDQDISSIFISGKQHVRSSGYGNVFQKNSATPRGQRLQELRRISDLNDSLIARGTQKSLIGNVEMLDGQVVNKIEETTSPVCILIESNRFSGYLLAALGKNQSIEENLIKNIQTALFKFLKDNGEEVTESETLNLKLEPVEFEPWALEYADFLKATVHHGDEIAMAFFPHNPVSPRFDESIHPDMVKVKLDDLRGDQRVEFDLYMHLENNNKFILYTPKGGIFYGKQMDRLKSHGVQHMHVHKESIGAVSRYHAQNYLNGLINDYSEKQRLFETAEAV